MREGGKGVREGRKWESEGGREGREWESEGGEEGE